MVDARSTSNRTGAGRIDLSEEQKVHLLEAAALNAAAVLVEHTEEQITPTLVKLVIKAVQDTRI